MRLMWVLSGLAAIPSPAFAGRITIPEAAVATALPARTETRPVQFSRLTIRIERGDPIGVTRFGLLCLGEAEMKWKSRGNELSTNAFQAAFRDELRQLGYDVVSNSDSLFDSEENDRAEYQIGATITMLSIDVCRPNSSLGDSVSARGSVLLQIDWQLYDRLARSVVARARTFQGYEQKTASAGGLTAILVSAFAQNVRALAASRQLLKLLVGPRREASITRAPSAGLPPIAMSVPSQGVAQLAKAVGSTILVETGSGHGSGFLISRDGYFLTNHHVVGGSKYVKLRWSDGLEALGEVIRTDKGRDVALIKGDPRDRAPLKIAEKPPEVGANVYAIGAPLDRKFQNSVTRGIFSARRIEDGYSFWQSDVAVNPGNSGGPLLNAQSDVVAITVSTYRTDNAPSGINFFIPAHEALEFLSIRPQISKP
ncbi:S1C family serine protease [Sphingobium fluviale]|uniref:Serine protease n=1 Tax=Sphingobium fluviale TaxID=2506423 RepID=A0A4Q1KI77_9SPHN|nr:S1C family serine protease [Sphingobium fluviale]RXR29493.1 serine protease [Sphingobium fluviale]